MANLYRLNPPPTADLHALCAGARENPSRRAFDHTAAFMPVQKDGVTVAAKDASGREVYKDKVPTGSFLASFGDPGKVVPIALAAVLGLLVIRKVRS